MGRCGLDLYAQQVGAAFEEVESFAAYVGGTPANTVVGAQRLGLRTALLSAVSQDPVGDLVLSRLKREGVETRFIARKPGTRTAASLLAMQPPDRFPIVMYREGCADNRIDLDDVAAAPVDDCRVFYWAGTNFSARPSSDATGFAIERARAAGVTVAGDLDYRPTVWSDARAYGVAVRSAVRLSHIVIGTVEEIEAATGMHGDAAIQRLLSLGPRAVVEKRGADGACVHLQDDDEGPVDAAGFSVEVQNTLGAGDAFAAGFLYSFVKGWDWYRCARFGNACGAIVVGRHGCSVSTPTYEEAMHLVTSYGGF